MRQLVDAEAPRLRAEELLAELEVGKTQLAGAEASRLRDEERLSELEAFCSWISVFPGVCRGMWDSWASYREVPDPFWCNTGNGITSS
jgi:hypothetical protein